LAERDLPEDSATREDEDRDDVAAEETGDAEPTPTSWALRGALVGAIAGSVVGAGLGMLFARRPETLTQAQRAIGGRGTHVARAAAVAAGAAMTSRHVNQLLKAESNGDRGELMKQAAREAGLPAAMAARDEIISLRGDAEGGNGAGS
jgi:hypothetical protein